MIKYLLLKAGNYEMPGRENIWLRIRKGARNGDGIDPINNPQDCPT